MKKRQCFVSNSSSSSFIIGIAKILDEDLLNSSNDVPKNIKEMDWIEAKKDNQRIEVEDFNYNIHFYDGEVKKGDKFVTIYYLNDAEDAGYDYDFKYAYEEINKAVESGAIENPYMKEGDGFNG